MARARNIKPGLYKNDDLVGCSFAARYLFPGLWMMADRRGRLEDRPLRIKMELLPADDIDVNALLSELCEAGMILRYAVGESRYIQIKNFEKHQKPHPKEAESVIPAPASSIKKEEPHPGATQTTPRYDPDQTQDMTSPAESLLSESLNADGADSGMPESRAPARKPHPNSPPDDDPNVVAAADILAECAWVGDELLEIRRGVARVFGMVGDFDRTQAAVEAESYAQYWAQQKKPPTDWYTAWLNWLKNWVKFRERDKQRPVPIHRNGRPREPDFSGIDAFDEQMSALEQRR